MSKKLLNAPSWQDNAPKKKATTPITSWSQIWKSNKSRLNKLFATKNSFYCWCGINFFPKVPAEVSVEEIIALKKKKGNWGGKYKKKEMKKNMKPILKFTKNFNKKLDRQFFTTIREDKKYWQNQQGEIIDITCENEKYCEGKIIFVLPTSLIQISESLAHFDSGLSKKELSDILIRLYGDNPNLQLLGVERIKKTETKEPEQTPIPA